MRRLSLVALICLLALLAPSWSRAAGVDAQGAFDQLKSLAGTWRGDAKSEGAETAAETEHAGEAVHEFRISSGGTVVMEIMNPGTGHEMINMYHRDGDDLVLTHYCAAGNQPTMRLDPARSTAGKLVFDFTGGANLDPSTDQHIHSAEITLVDSDHVESAWMGQVGGMNAGVMTFHLARSQ